MAGEAALQAIARLVASHSPLRLVVPSAASAAPAVVFAPAVDVGQPLGVCGL